MSRNIPKVERTPSGVLIPREVQHDTYIYYGALFRAINEMRYHDREPFNAGIIHRGTQYGRRQEKAVRFLMFDLLPTIYRSASLDESLLNPDMVPSDVRASVVEIAAGQKPVPPADTRIAVIPRMEQSGLVAIHRMVTSWDRIGAELKPGEVSFMATIELPGGRAA
jgi:hypothetical protein